MSPASIAGNAGARPGTRTARDVPLARRRARAGLSSLVEIGFFFWPYEPEYTARMATLAAQRTRRARVAACVTNAVTRHPAITATAAASIDLIAPGRTVLGVGAGHSGVANVGSAPAPAAALGEAVTFMRRLLH